MNFAETVMGQRFFNAELPALITSMKEIAASLNHPRPVLQVSQPVSDDFLVRLYYDNFDPETAPDRETHAFYNSVIAQAQEEIKKGVTAEMWQMIEHSYSTIATRGNMEREQAFAAGFRTAISMLVAGLAVPSVHNEE